MKTKIILSILWTLSWIGFAILFNMPWSLALTPGIYLYFIVYFALLYVINAIDDRKKNIYESILSFSAVGGFVVFLVGFIFMSLYSLRLFHVNTYKEQIGVVTVEQFTANIAPVSPEQMITVDEEMAHRIGGKVLGEDPGLGSRCQLGKFTLQPVQGHLYWIAPLEHSGFWKWKGNDSTPGYVVVNATDERDYRLVTKTPDGKPMTLRYQPGAYWGDDLDMHIYLQGYTTVGITDRTFEVDDHWYPYWTVTLYETMAGFGGKESTGILVIDPATGVITNYSLDKVPAWVDRVHPFSFVKSQVYNWGDLVHGVWNWSGRDKLHVADDNSIVMGPDNKMYYYLGLQSKGAEQGTVGFIMVDCRTKQSTWIKQAGATEQAARDSAEGSLQEKDYVGSEGITYNVDGLATYEFLMKDKSGLMKSIALVNVHDHGVVGIGENRLMAIRNYLTKMNSRGNVAREMASDLDLVTREGIISRFNGEVNSGNTVYYFLLEGVATPFYGTSSVASELSLTKMQDKVVLTYFAKEAGEIEIKSFDNLDIGISKTLIETKLLIQHDSLRGEELKKSF